MIFSTALLFLVSTMMVSKCFAASLGVTATMESVDVLEGQWMDFDCPYDATLDKANLHELAATVQRCDQPLELQQDAGQFSRAIVAAVLGRVSQLSPNIKAGVLKDRSPPALHINTEHPLVRAGLVEAPAAESSLGLIRLRVRARGNTTDGLCAMCGQTLGAFQYSLVKVSSLRIQKPPVASLSFVSEQNQSLPSNNRFSETRDADGNRRVELLAGALPGWLVCAGAGEQLSALRLFKDGQLLNQTADSRLEQRLGPSFKEDLVGTYRCEAVTSQPFLVAKGKNSGSDAIYLLVPFKPRFELSEVVRYTPVGQQEDIRVKVFAYPQPTPMVCSLESKDYQAPQPEPLQPYTDKDFSVTYLIRLSNNLPGNETKLSCQSANDQGRAELSVRLTALAPQPEIVSDGATRFYNSYRLRWQHDAGAYVDFYRVQIVLRDGGSNSTIRHEEFTANSAVSPPSGSTAALVGTLTDGGGGGGGFVSGSRSGGSGEKRENSRTLYNLRPDTEHEIRLSACNQHGCSRFSPPVRVRTQKQSDNTYNDPTNPVKAYLNPEGSASTLAVSAALLLSMALVTGSLVPGSQQL